MNKYGSKRTEVDGILFDSKKEANRYAELKMMERAKLISNLELQVPFELIPAQKRNNRVVERACSYIADFVYYDKEMCETVVEDVKSPATRTDAYKIKKKLMLQKYNIEIREV